MKIRALRKIFGDYYIIANYEKYLAFGSALCHNLISLDVETLKIKYALDTFNKGRESLKSSKLKRIWDKLHEMAENKSILEYLKEDDILESPIKVYESDYGDVIEHYTDKIGWTNVTSKGFIMYENTFFESKTEAAKRSKNEAEYYIRDCEQKISEYENSISERLEQINLLKIRLDKMNDILVV